MVKLYNKTRYPDAILSALLTRAGRSIGARTSGVVVKVTAGRTSGHCRGLATECDWVYEWSLRNLKSRRQGKRIKGRAIATDGGEIELTLPLPSKDCLATAENVFAVALHEWGHIRDFQHGGRLRFAFSTKAQSGRRPAWRDRPEEIRADEYRKDALAKIDKGKVQSADDEILALALWMESTQEIRI